MSACDRCAKSIKRADDVITCMGFCEHIVHLRCTNFEKSIAKAISDSQNLFWMCDECTKLMKIVCFQNAISSVGNSINELTKNQEAANAELKSVLAKHSEQIAQLSSRIQSTTPTIADSVSRRAMKRRRTEELAPIAKPLLGGTKSTDDVSIATVPPPTPLFWIYLSRLHTSVKPDIVEKLTKDSLHCESAKAVPLVKQGTDINSLNFISFKVGVDPKYRLSALDPSSWPKGILFREFEDNRAKNFWMPDPCSPSIIVTDSLETPQHAPSSMITADC